MDGNKREDSEGGKRRCLVSFGGLFAVVLGRGCVAQYGKKMSRGEEGITQANKKFAFGETNR